MTNIPCLKKYNLFIRGVPLPFYAATSSAIKIHPSGKYLYAGNRAYLSATEDIAMFSINPDDGTLFYLGNMDTKGEVPRDFEIDPTGNFLIVANQETNNLVSFKIDQETGKLTPTGFELAIGTATCIKFMRS
ncbi:MAG: beta-propeller fold lactonase family protein [Saprospiraceae bacterium]